MTWIGFTVFRQRRNYDWVQCVNIITAQSPLTPLRTPKAAAIFHGSVRVAQEATNQARSALITPTLQSWLGLP